MGKELYIEIENCTFVKKTYMRKKLTETNLLIIEKLRLKVKEMTNVTVLMQNKELKKTCSCERN